MNLEELKEIKLKLIIQFNACEVDFCKKYLYDVIYQLDKLIELLEYEKKLNEIKR